MVEFGVSLPTIGMDNPDAVRLVAEQAEAAGFDSVWAADHIVLPTSTSSPYPYDEGGEFLISSSLPFMDQFTTLSFAAGITRRVMLGSAVTLLPLRHPLHTAKVTATLDVLSRGRVILGVAAGWLEEEFRALGVSFEHRGKLLDEGLELLLKAWTHPEIDHDGASYQARGVASYPHPVQQPHPPIWVGGHTKPVLRRAARYGDMWFPPLFQTTPEKLAASLAEIEEMAQRLGRPKGAVGQGLRVLVDLREQPDQASAARRGALTGPPERVVETLKGYVDIGSRHFVFLPQARTLEDVQRTIDILAEHIVPKLRAAS